MSEQAITSTHPMDANTPIEMGDVAAAGARATVLIATIQQRDAWIAAGEREIERREEILRGLECHPALWMVLGREGIDTPGSRWSTTTGQQVITRTRIRYGLVGVVGVGGVLVGMVLGVWTEWDVTVIVDFIQEHMIGGMG